MTLTAEQREILSLATDFATAEIEPHGEAWDAALGLPDELFGSLVEVGFTAMALPEAYGGLDLDPAVYLAVLTAIARADASAATALAVHNAIAALLVEVDGAGHAPSLERLAGGDLRAAAAIREGDLDVDPSSMETVWSGDAITGRKSWVVEPTRAEGFLVLANEGSGTSAFWVERSEKVRVENRRTTMGLRAVEFADVVFEGASATRVGAPGDGPAVLAVWQRLEQLAWAAIAVGVAEASRAHAVRYSQEREQFGRSLARFDAIRRKLADVDARTRAAAALLASVAGGTGVDGAAAAKLFASETAMFASDEAVQIFGGYGYMRDYPVERLMRDAKGIEVLGSTSESLRRLLAIDLMTSGA